MAVATGTVAAGSPDQHAGKGCYSLTSFLSVRFCVWESKAISFDTPAFSCPLPSGRCRVLNCLLAHLSPRSSTDLQESDLAAVGSRMLFPSSSVSGSGSSLHEGSSRGLPDVNDLGLGLQSLSLSGWERPWSSHDTDTHTTAASQAHTSSTSSEYWNTSFVVNTELYC